MLWEVRIPGQALRLLATPHFVAVALKSGILQVITTETLYSALATISSAPPCHACQQKQPSAAWPAE